MTGKFIIGLIGAPFGVKGFVRVHSLSGEIEHLLKLQSAVVNKDGRERIYQIAESSPAPPAVLIRFAGIDSPEKAKALTGAELITGREQAAPLNDGEFYIEDLKELQVFTENGETIGRIMDIIEGGGGELVEILLANCQKRLVPFRREFFKEISLGDFAVPYGGNFGEKGRAVMQNLWILE